MRKLTLLAATAVLSLGLPQLGHAQTATTSSTSGSGALAIAGGATTVVMPATGLTTGAIGVPTGIGGATWVMGQTTGGNNVTSYDACLKNAQLTVLFAAVAIPLEISHCWALRDMEAMAKFPPGSIQYEHGCRDSAWQQTDWDTGTMKCTANQAKLRKNNPSDPRVQPFVATPVVMPGMNAVPASAPPTVVPVNGTNRQVSEVTQPKTYPLCSATVTDGCRYR